MKSKIRKIMLVTNGPSDSIGAELTAQNIAKSHQATVLLVDSIATPFHALRYQSLSTEVMFEAAFNAKMAYLEKIRGRLAQAGIDASCSVLTTQRTSAELIRTAIENDCDLVVRYIKGQSSRAAGRFGETAANLMRACPVPVLLTQSEIESPNVVACVNPDHGKEENSVIVDQATQMAGGRDHLKVLSCWEYSGGSAFSFDYMDEGLAEQTKIEVADMYNRLFENFKVEHELEDAQCFLVNRNPAMYIPQFCSQHGIDIAAVCSASLNHPVGRKIGSTIERMIADLPCALLTVKPLGFSSPINSDKPNRSEVCA